MAFYITAILTMGVIAYVIMQKVKWVKLMTEGYSPEDTDSIRESDEFIHAYKTMLSERVPIRRESWEEDTLIYYVESSVVPIENLRGVCKKTVDMVCAEKCVEEVKIRGHLDRYSCEEIQIGFRLTPEDLAAKDWEIVRP